MWRGGSPNAANALPIQSARRKRIAESMAGGIAVARNRLAVMPLQ